MARHIQIGDTFVITSDVDSDPIIQQAINEVYTDYGVTVSVDDKKKSLLKFGRNPAVGSSATGYTIWSTGADQAHETLVATNTNSIDSISSSDTGDTVDIVIEGHTQSGGNRTFVTQTVTLNGRTRVALDTALNRVTRAYNAGSQEISGGIQGYLASVVA